MKVNKDSELSSCIAQVKLAATQETHRCENATPTESVQ